MSSKKKTDLTKDTPTNDTKQTHEDDENQNQNQDQNETDNDNQEEITDPNVIQTLYLKAIANDGYATPYDRIAQEMDIPRSQADQIITQVVENMVGTNTEHDYPTRMLEFYNKYAPTEDDELTVNDVVVLMRLVDRFFVKIKPRDKERIQAKMKKMGTREQFDNKPKGYDPRKDAIPPRPVQQQSTQPEEDKNRVTFTDSQSQQQQQGPPTQQQQQQRVSVPVPDQYTQYETDESLLKYLLESNINVRDPSKIPYFLQWFSWNKNDLIRNPMKLLVTLNASFPRVVAETVLQQFMDARNKLPTNAAALGQLTGASNYQPLIPPNSYLSQVNPALGEFINQYGGGMGQFGYQGQQSHPGIEPPDPLDKELQRLSKIIGMGMMKQMAGGQMAGQGPNGQNQIQYGPDVDRHEIYDSAGRLSEVRYVKKAYPIYGMPPVQDPNVANNQMMMKFMELMMTTANEDKKLLMQKVMQGDSQGLNEVINTILKQAVGAMSQQTDPAIALGKYLELGQKVADMRQQPQKSAEERKIEMDYILAKNEQQYAEAEKARQFQRERDEAANADARYHDTVREVGNVIKEAAGPILEIAKNTLGRGLGGNMPGMFPPGQGMPAQSQQRVVVQQVPVSVQPEQQQQQQQARYTEEQIRLIREEELRRRQAMQAQAERQQEMDNRPIEDVLAEMSNEEIEEMAHRFEEDATRLEFTGNKIMSERARRKGHGFTPNRRHVAPIVQAIAAHEQQQAQNQYQSQVSTAEEEEEPSINVFEPEPMPEPSSSPTSTAIDVSGSYDDDNVKEAMRIQGMLPEDDAQSQSQTDIEQNQSVGVPASSSMPSTIKREEEREEFELDENDLVDDGETTIE